MTPVGILGHISLGLGRRASWNPIFGRSFSWDRAACRPGSWTVASLTRDLSASLFCATLNKAGGKNCLGNPLETLHRNGLAHRTFSDQLTGQHIILDNSQTLGTRLRQQL